MSRLLKRSVTAMVAVFAVIQLIPYGRAHDNPPVRMEPSWDSPETRALAERACFDCHSNETEWPWYSWIAPTSWLVTHDVEEARGHMNFSEWDREQDDADEAAEMVEEGEMPHWTYVPLHPEARLTPEERGALVRGLEATIGEEVDGKDGEGGRRRRRGRDH